MVACPKCKYENREDASFCNMCKTVLRHEPAAPHAEKQIAPAENEERIDSAMRDALVMAFDAMPRMPREQHHEVTLPAEGAKFPDQCPGCGVHAAAKAELTTPWWSSGAKRTVVVPFCWKCVRLVEQRKKRLAIRAGVVAALCAVTIPIHFAIAVVFLVDLLRIAWIALTRGWWFGARVARASEDVASGIVLSVDDRAYADALRALNPPQETRPETTAVAQKPRPAMEAFAVTAQSTETTDKRPAPKLAGSAPSEEDDETQVAPSKLPERAAAKHNNASAPDSVQVTAYEGDNFTKVEVTRVTKPAPSPAESKAEAKPDTRIEPMPEPRAHSKPPPVPAKTPIDVRHSTRPPAPAPQVKPEPSAKPPAPTPSAAPKTADITKPPAPVPSPAPKSIAPADAEAKTKPPTPAPSKLEPSKPEPSKPELRATSKPSAPVESKPSKPDSKPDLKAIKSDTKIDAKAAKTAIDRATSGAREPFADRPATMMGPPPTEPKERATSTAREPAERPSSISRGKSLSLALGVQVKQLCEEGDLLAKEHRYVNALVKFEEALQVLPPPAEQWRISSRVYTALGDAYFHLHDWSGTERYMKLACTTDQGAKDPFVLLRLGQARLELGDTKSASEALSSAHRLGGDALFEKEPEKYRAAVSSAGT